MTNSPFVSKSGILEVSSKSIWYCIYTSQNGTTPHVASREYWSEKSFQQNCRCSHKFELIRRELLSKDVDITFALGCMLTVDSKLSTRTLM